MTKGLAFVLVLVALLLLPAPVAASLPDLVTQTVHFEVPGKDLIAGVAAFRASCDAVASGEPLSLLDNGSVRTTVAASPGDCSMILVLLGIDVAIPTITTTPIGRSSAYLPGVSLPTLGLADVSLDLQTSMNSTTRVVDAGVAAVTPTEANWTTWGAQRLVVQGAHGYGSAVASSLETTFTYAVSLSLTIWVAGIQVYQTGLTDFGAYAGTPSLTTSLAVDLLPHPLRLGPATDVTHEGASLNWTGVIDPDTDHLELWVTDGSTNVSYRITDRVVSSMSLPLRPQTTYHAWLVTVDRGGQASVSNGVTFTTLAAPAPTPEPTPTPTYTEEQANLIVVLTFASIALLAALVAYGFGRTRGKT